MDDKQNISVIGEPKVTSQDGSGKTLKMTATRVFRKDNIVYVEGMAKISGEDYDIFANRIEVNEEFQSGTAEGDPYFVRNLDRLYGDKINFSQNTLEIIGNGFGWSYTLQEEGVRSGEESC